MRMEACDVCNRCGPALGRFGLRPWLMVCASCIDKLMEALGL